jgi:predicted amidohydrolase
MRAHLVQYSIAWEDKAANHAAVESMLARAGIESGDFVLLPEMFDTGFSLNIERTADTDRASTQFIASLARRLGVTIQAGITVPGPGGKALNRAIVFGPQGEALCAYDKIHPFSYGRESERFVGGTHVTTFAWGTGDDALSVCPAVCYDLRFPELFRAGLAMGAQVFAVGANWPAARIAHWRALLIARAIENQAFVLGTNRCGSDPHLDYPGGSIAIDPRGRILAEAGAGTEVLSVEIQAGVLNSWREAFPAWKDRSRALA